MATKAEVSGAAVEGATKVCTHHPLELYQQEPGCKCGKLRPPRKFHALIGLWLTLFVTIHLAICVTGTSPVQYQSTVSLIHRWLAYFPGALLLTIFLPLLLQSASGLYLATKEGMKYDIKRCDRGGKMRFFLQRLSGLAILVFLLVHVGSMYGWSLGRNIAHLLDGRLPEGNAFSYTASVFQPWTSSAANLFSVAFLLAGVLGMVYHAANGLLSGAILWKIVESPGGRTRCGYVCAGIAIVLAVMGTVAWHAFTLSPNVPVALAATSH
jgi:succinate dehydrogenase/fumarate reductase cytochrome b subunit